MARIPDRESMKRMRMQARSTVPVKRKIKQPQDKFRQLFHDVQIRADDDSKKFVDAVPITEQKSIMRAYERERHQPDFDLMTFLGKHFVFPHSGDDEAVVSESMSHHITELWGKLNRTSPKTKGSLLALPYPYIVPGGRFNEFFYWDSYFISLGLHVEHKRREELGIIKNMTYQLRSHGYIPTANRSYLLTRSQPPYFSRMARLATHDVGAVSKYVPYMVFEYRFWVRDRRKLSASKTASKRVVWMPDGTILNRYYDEMDVPRPESYPEDVKTAEMALERRAGQVYLDVRAAAESGWDFSSRWFGESNTLASIRTTDLVPIDLNCLLYELEITIAEGYRELKQIPLAKRFEQAAAQRAKTINTYLWDESTGYYHDYHFPTGRRSGHRTIAGVYALSAGVASDEQAASVAKHIEQDFLKPGGVVTSLVHSGQQWDAPNGWAPMQWETIIGLRKYGYDDLADIIKQRFIECAELTYRAHGKLVEKYNVVSPGTQAAGGEYALQDGFGWTNGVLQALLHDLDKKL